MPNYDETTGYHFGCISFNSVNPEALQGVYDKGKNLTYEAFVQDVKTNLRSAVRDNFSDSKWCSRNTSDLDNAVEAMYDAIEDDLNDSYQAEDEQYLYEADGYKISNSPLLCCLFVELSPYYTYARACSPCTPNAGDLDHADGSLKTYCLGPEWFEDENRPPYKVYRVVDDSVIAEVLMQSP